MYFYPIYSTHEVVSLRTFSITFSRTQQMSTLISTSERALIGIFFIVITFYVERTLKGKALKLEQKLDCSPPENFY